MSVGKRIRKRFATKGEATAFEHFTMIEVKTGQNSYNLMAKTIAMLNNPIAHLFTKKDYLAYRVSYHRNHPNAASHHLLTTSNKKPYVQCLTDESSTMY